MSNLVIAIQGIPGSFHHQVAIRYFGAEAELLTFQTFEAVAKAVATGQANFGVMAIENSIAGAILPNYELIDRFDLNIRDEYYLPISHQLMALPGQKIEEIHTVASHPMALLQCKKFLSEYPHLVQKDDVDTASVAREISEKQLKGKAAIASEVAAEIYGLEILARDIQSVKENATRFIILQKEHKELFPTPNKASFKISIKNQPGGLAKLLTMLYEKGLDLSKIQSIPVIDKPWDYAFFIDAEFKNYSSFLQAMEACNINFGKVKIFGQYLSRKP